MAVGPIGTYQDAEWYRAQRRLHELHPQVFGTLMGEWIKGYRGLPESRMNDRTSPAHQWYRRGQAQAKRDRTETR